MNKLLTIGTLGAAGIVGAGLLTIPGLALTGATDEAAMKREDGVAELVLVDDEDDDDTADRDVTMTGTSRVSRSTRTSGAGAATGAVRQQQAPRDNTVSNFTHDDPTSDTVSQDVSRDSRDSSDVSRDSRDVSDDSNE